MPTWPTMDPPAVPAAAQDSSHASQHSRIREPIRGQTTGQALFADAAPRIRTGGGRGVDAGRAGPGRTGSRQTICRAGLGDAGHRALAIGQVGRSPQRRGTCVGAGAKQLQGSACADDGADAPEPLCRSLAHLREVSRRAGAPALPLSGEPRHHAGPVDTTARGGGGVPGGHDVGDVGPGHSHAAGLVAEGHEALPGVGGEFLDRVDPGPTALHRTDHGASHAPARLQLARL